MNKPEPRRLATQEELAAMHTVVTGMQALGRLVVYHNCKRRDLREIAQQVAKAKRVLKLS